MGRKMKKQKPLIQIILKRLYRNSKIMSEKGEDDSLQSREDTDKSTSTEEEIINQMDEVEQANANNESIEKVSKQLWSKLKAQMIKNRDKRKNYKSKPFCITDESTDDDDVGQGSSLLKNPIQPAIDSDIDTRDKPSTSADNHYSFSIGNTNGNNETNGQSNHSTNNGLNDDSIEQQNVDESEESIELESSNNNTDDSKETDSNEDEPTENEPKRRRLV